MAMTIDELGKLLENQEICFWLHPSRSRLLMTWAGINAAHRVMLLLELDGTFLQFRTQGWLRCPSSHPHVDTVLRLLGEINYSLRFIKVGYDARDGEIVVYADVWVGDNKLTADQLEHMIGNYVTATDLVYRRIQQVIESGKDPGEDKPVDIVRRLLGRAEELPDPLKELLQHLEAVGDSDLN